MKRSLVGLAAVAVLGGSMISTAFAATSTHQFFKMTIEVNGAIVSTPYGVAESDGSNTTTYIPLYYVNEALTKVGYQVSWNGTTKTWALTTSSSSGSFANGQVGTGNTQITVNGKLVRELNSVVQADPEGGASTTYIPIYYVTPLFLALGMSATWDGNTHIWSIDSTSTASGTGSTTVTVAPELTPPKIVQTTNGGSANITVSGAASGATLMLYNTSGKEVISTAAQSNGTGTFYNVAPASYYVVESSNGATSGGSNVVTIAATTSTSSAPTLFTGESNGVWYVGVNNATAGATVTLYDTNGNKIASATANQYGYATFDSVGSGSYYIIETLNGQSMQSTAIAVNTTSTSTSSPLSPPTLAVDNSGTSGIISATNVAAGATVTLYASSGAVTGTVTANASGEATFNNISNGLYYAVQTSNGQQSPASNSVSVSVSTLSAPTAVGSTSQGGANSITVSNVSASALVTLYSASGSTYASATANSSGQVTFNDVSSGVYDAKQMWNGVQSAASNSVTIGAVLPTPTAAYDVSQSTIDVSNVVAGATVTLYTATGALFISTTATGTTASFTGVGSGSYYVIQTLNGETSLHSNTITF